MKVWVIFVFVLRIKDEYNLYRSSAYSVVWMLVIIHTAVPNCSLDGTRTYTGSQVVTCVAPAEIERRLTAMRDGRFVHVHTNVDLWGSS